MSLKIGTHHSLVRALLMGLVLSLSAIVFQTPLPASAADPVIAGAGDVACDPSLSSFNGGLGSSTTCRQKYTSDLLLTMNPDAVLELGDGQNEQGTLDQYMKAYDPSWGRVKGKTHPVSGNHDYLTAGASGYYTYFGAAAHDPTKGYYSYDMGSWHVVALNSQCSEVGGCGTGSPQETWLRSDLAAHPTACTLAYWHIPLWSSGGRAAPNAQVLMQDLYNANAEVVLNGHDHVYERFAPQNPQGQADNTRGIREFVVGTGGANHTSFTTTAANSQFRNATTFGVLKLTLHPTSYDWQFVAESGSVLDSGTTVCHDAGGVAPTATRTTVPGATPTPMSTTVSGGTDPFTFNPVADAYVDASLPSTNYGTGTSLRVDGSPLVRSFLRFTVSGLTGSVTQATLRLYANSAQSTGYGVYPVSSNTWGETTITAGNAPALGSLIRASGAVSAGTWVAVDVTPYITGNGTWSLALTTSSSTALSLASREATNKPQLIIQSSSSGGATATAVPTMPAATNTPTPTVVGATPTKTNAATPTSTLPANTATPTNTMPANTATPTATRTATAVVVNTPTRTATPANTPTRTPTPASTGGTFTFAPVADSYVDSASTSTNNGTATQLRIDGSPIVRSYLRFNVTGLTGTVATATLRLYANSSAGTGGQVRGVTSNTWGETTITYSNAPAPSGTVTGTSGAFSAGAWATVSITPLITGNGTFSIAVTTTGSTAVSLGSRESGSHAPQLVITTK